MIGILAEACIEIGISCREKSPFIVQHYGRGVTAVSGLVAELMNNPRRSPSFAVVLAQSSADCHQAAISDPIRHEQQTISYTNKVGRMLHRQGERTEVVPSFTPILAFAKLHVMVDVSANCRQQPSGFDLKNSGLVRVVLPKS